MQKIDVLTRFSNVKQVAKDPVALTSGLVAFGIVMYV